MAMQDYTIDSTDWVEVSTVDNILSNNSSYPLKVAYTAIKPLVSSKAFILLSPNEAIIKNGDFPAGNTYVLAFKGNENDVAVAE